MRRQTAWAVVSAGLLTISLVGCSGGNGGLDIATCPAESRPDAPGAADQARPSEISSAAFDSQSGRVVVLESPSQVTWTFDVCTNEWEKVLPPDGAPPYSGLELEYDAGTDLTVAFAEAPEGIIAWTYSVEDNVWTELPEVAPAPEQVGTLVFDPIRGRILTGDVLTGRLWAFDSGANTWADIDQGDTQIPDPLAPLTFDTKLNRVVLTSVPGPTWLLDPASGEWTEQGAESPQVNLEPGPRGGAATFDAAGSRTVLFGDGVLATYDAAADEWSEAERGSGWPPAESGSAGDVSDDPEGDPQEVATTIGPLARTGHTLLYDAVNERVLLVGGHARTAGGWQASTDVWAFDPPTNTWAELVPSGNLSVAHDGSSAVWKAEFVAADAGATAALQMQTIATTMTADVAEAEWSTIATAGVDVDGGATFAVADPLEVLHDYRAVVGPAGAERFTNVVSYAAPRETKNTGLATIYLDTNDGEDVLSDLAYVEGTFAMAAGSQVPECSAMAPTRMKIRGRGEYGWSLDKEPYNVNLDDKSDLCGLGGSKKWALLANHYDRSLLRTSAAMYIGSQLTNMAWTPRSIPVDLYLNGTYVGSYTLIERINVASDRVDIDELQDNQGGVNDSAPNVTGGYLLEWDFRKSADHNVEVGQHGWVGIKEPEDEDDGSGITAAQITYIDQYLDEVDAALFGGDFEDDVVGWKRYIDTASLVDYYIAQELTKTVDGNMYASVLMYKERDVDPAPGDQGKLLFGPMWDYDTSLGNATYPGGQGDPTGWYLRDPQTDPDYFMSQSQVTWFNRLNEDPEFRELVAARWQEIRVDLQTTDSFIDQQAMLIEASAAENFTVWDVTERFEEVQVVKGSWDAEVSHLRSWLQQRIAWMDGQLG